MTKEDTWKALTEPTHKGGFNCKHYDNDRDMPSGTCVLSYNMFGDGDENMFPPCDCYSDRVKDSLSLENGLKFWEYDGSK